MKELLDQYAIYNVWANARILNVIGSLDESKVHREIPSSFNSLYKTAFHVFGATSTWYGRFQQEPFILEKDPFQGSISALVAALQDIDLKWMDWVVAKDEAFLLQTWSYKNLKGIPCNDPVCE
ncbi:MAG TPA: DinB family protein, partial [Puia sp.]|nr:DinB family protein [Puia sp.]